MSNSWIQPDDRHPYLLWFFIDLKQTVNSDTFDPDQFLMFTFTLQYFSPQLLQILITSEHFWLGTSHFTFNCLPRIPKSLLTVQVHESLSALSLRIFQEIILCLFDHSCYYLINPLYFSFFFFLFFNQLYTRPHSQKKKKFILYLTLLRNFTYTCLHRRSCRLAATNIVISLNFNLFIEITFYCLNLYFILYFTLSSII